MTAPKPRPLKPLPKPSPPAGSRAFDDMLQTYYEMPGCRELVNGIIERKRAREGAKVVESRARR
ncbi:hypothetical protein PBI_EDMUNDO_59 [Arthrobacter phage Edmundo]|uniref:HTH DNA binding domain protein n=1 Tax=Arthrobacter phage Wheelbite TaxID=2015873 RepID=A0A222ZHI8_9CAUD|nr:HTH DNA binding protein [Arthrobacter phage Wheelbite]ASR84187.1 HTH DNA binding domain protein [Arthrobacter phage Wheelbite]QGJ88131.1 hypothetical protein PBI_EDMUNDO_59 [Arthrobacter phage Edmundo]